MEYPVSSDELTLTSRLSAGDSPTRSRRLPAIAWGTLIAGTLDISSAILMYLPRGVSPSRILQSVASGVLGRASFEGGAATAVLGLSLHFAIMSVIVAIYATASRRFTALVRHPVASGALYGMVVFGVMNFIVVPLSAAGGGRPALRDALLQLGIHIVCVGLSIAFITRRFAGER